MDVYFYSETQHTVVKHNQQLSKYGKIMSVFISYATAVNASTLTISDVPHKTTLAYPQRLNLPRQV
jgi:hypothetical protein